MILLDWSRRPKAGIAQVPPRRKIAAEAMSVTLKERDGSASLTTWDLDDININSWLMDDTEPGKDICWRVKSIEQVPGTDTNRVSLEHAINLLRDRIIWGEWKPADIIKAVTGRESDATTCLASEALIFIMGGQEDWLLDMNPKSFEYKEVYGAYSFDGDTLYDALETVCGTLEDCEWLMDMSKYPFTLRIRKKLNGVAAEVRAGRNLRTITKTIDRGGMYTRLFPVGNDDLQLDTERDKACVEDGVKTYGIIEKSETNSSLDTTQNLTNWAKNKLHYKSQPTVTITVDALELSEATGESMDHFVLGRLCRVPLPEYGGEIFTERITEISFSDKIGRPTECRLTLSNAATELTTIIASLAKESSSASRSSARTSKSLTDTKNTLLYAVKDVRISGPVKNIYTLEYLLVLDKEGDNWRKGGNFSRAVDDWKVSAAGGAIRVEALPQEQDHVVYVQAGKAKRDENIYTGPIEWQHSTDGGKTFTDWAKTGAEYVVDATERYNAGWKDAQKKVSLPKTEASNYYITIKTPSSTVGEQDTTYYYLTNDGNNAVVLYTLGKDSAHINVAKLVHNRYNNGWAAAYNKVSLPVTASDNYYITIKTPASTVGQEATTYYYLTNDGDNAVALYTLNASSEIVYVAKLTHNRYNNGWRAAYNKVSLPVTASDNYYITIKTPAYTVGQEATTYYYLTNDGDNAVALYTLNASSEIVYVAKLTHNRYINGWRAAYNKVSLPVTASDNYYITIKTPAYTVGQEDTTYYYLTNDGDNAVALYTLNASSEIVYVAKMTHNRYNNGWAAARNMVSLPATAASNYYITIYTPSSTVGGQDATYYYLTNDGNNAVVLYTLGADSAQINVASITHNRYNNGWSAAYNKVSLPTTAASNYYITIKTPSSGVGGQDSRHYYLTNDGNNAVILYTLGDNDAHITVASLTHNRYNNGWSAAYTKVSLPTTAASNYYITIKTPASSVGSQDTRYYYLTNDGNNAVVLYTLGAGDEQINVAKLTHNKYTAGWNAARSAETRVTMSRGAYDEQSHTYTCTCTLSGTIATGATFYLYAR